MAKTPIVKPLGLVIQTAGLVNAGQVQIALEDRQLFPHLKIGQIMARRGWISQQTADFFAEQWPRLLDSKARERLGQYLKDVPFNSENIFHPGTLELIEPPRDYIQNCLLNNPRCEPTILLDLYRQIRQQKEIVATRSIAEQELIKSGLVIAEERKIKLDYLGDRYNFDNNWIQEQLIRLQPYSKIRVKLWGLEAKANDPYRVIAEVNKWTGEDPELNQNIYQVLRDRCCFIVRGREALIVSELVYKYVINGWETKLTAPHLLKLRDRVLNPPLDLALCLLSYQKVWYGQSIPFDRSPQQQYLIEIGLIKLEHNQIRIANRIYRDVFDRNWLKKQSVVNRSGDSKSNNDSITILEPNSASVNQQKSSGLIKILTLLVCLSGVAWFGWNLFGKYQQVQQFKQANSLLAQKKYTAAIDVYDRLLGTNISNRHQIWVNRGYAFSGLNQYQDMLQSCSNATLTKPEAGIGWNCQGEALYYLKQYPQALSAFERATNKNPQEATFWLNKVRVLSNLQEYEAAISASTQAIKSIGNSQLNNSQKKEYLAIALNQQGQNLLKTSRYRESMAAFEQSLENSPNYLSAKQGKGIALYELGKYQQAIALFTDLLQRDNLTPEQQAMSWLYTGVSQCQAQQFEAAQSAFEKVLELTQDSQSQNIATKGCGIQ